MQQIFVTFLWFILVWSVFGLIVGLWMVFAPPKTELKKFEIQRGTVKILTTLFAIIISGLSLWFLKSETIDEWTMIPIVFVIIVPELIASLYFANKRKQLKTNN